MTEDFRNQYEYLSGINDEYNKWARSLNEQQLKISQLETNLEIKKSLLNKLDQNLDIIKDRQKRFDKLISIYEAKLPQSNDLTRPEVLEMAQSLSKSLEVHDDQLQHMNRDVRTLKDMLYLLTDMKCRFDEIRHQAEKNYPELKETMDQMEQEMFEEDVEEEDVLMK